jgi:hypothetical protein
LPLFAQSGSAHLTVSCPAQSPEINFRAENSSLLKQAVSPGHIARLSVLQLSAGRFIARIIEADCFTRTHSTLERASAFSRDLACMMNQVICGGACNCNIFNIPEYKDELITLMTEKFEIIIYWFVRAEN